MKALGYAVLLAVCLCSVLAASPAAATVALTDGYVTPTTGGTSTLYSFCVTYWDTAGLAPTARRLYIDGAGPYTMALESGSYATGAKFLAKIYLGPGAHDFRFHFQSAGAIAAFWPSVGTREGPVVSAVYNIIDYFPLSGSWTYLTNAEALVGTDTCVWDGTNGCLHHTFTPSDGSASWEWWEYWSRAANGIFLFAAIDKGQIIPWSLNTPFRIPNGLYVGQTATTTHIYSGTAVPAYCTYRLDGVERISAPWGSAECLKVTITISSIWHLRRRQIWLAKNVGCLESVEFDEGKVTMRRLVSRTP